MSYEVRRDMDRARQWSSIVMPAVRDALWTGASLIDVEHDRHPISRKLDASSGIDWIVEDAAQLYGVSVRCQQYSFLRYCLDHYGSPTFTIREERIGTNYRIQSELTKTIEAVKHGAITAAFQVHAYMSSDGAAIAACGVARRIPLFRHVIQMAGVGRNSTKDEQRNQRQQFVYVSWDTLSDDILVSVKMPGRDHFSAAVKRYTPDEADRWLYDHGYTRNAEGRWVNPKGEVY